MRSGRKAVIEKVSTFCMLTVNDSRQHFLARPRIGEREADRGGFVKGVGDQMQCQCRDGKVFGELWMIVLETVCCILVDVNDE
jgi:hypothetical protein